VSKALCATNNLGGVMTKGQGDLASSNTQDTVPDQAILKLSYEAVRSEILSRIATRGYS